MIEQTDMVRKGRGAMPDVTLTPVRINDSARLKESVFRDMKTSEISAYIRSSIADSSVSLYIASVTGDGISSICGLAGLYGIHPVHNNAWIYCRFPEVWPADDDQIEIIKSRISFRNRTAGTAELYDTGTGIEELKPTEVFERRIENDKLEENTAGMLREAFAELLEEVLHKQME